MISYKSLNETIQDLKEQGYSREIGCSDLSALQPENWCVEQVVRFENTDDPIDSTSVYALYQFNGGRRALLINNYRADMEPQKNAFLSRIPLTGAQITSG